MCVCVLRVCVLRVVMLGVSNFHETNLSLGRSDILLKVGEY